MQNTGGFNPGGRGQIYDDTMFNRATADTTLTTMNANLTSTQGPYVPKANGFLLSIAIVLVPQAASSLCQSGYVVLTCTSFQPINSITIAFPGFGLATAPQAQNPVPFIRNMNLPVSTALGIQGQDFFNASPVTPQIYIQGTFWAKANPTG